MNKGKNRVKSKKKARLPGGESRASAIRSQHECVDHAQPGEGFDKFKSDMGARLKIAQQNGASYELRSNSPIPEHVKVWLTKKGIPFFEH